MPAREKEKKRRFHIDYDFAKICICSGELIICVYWEWSLTLNHKWKQLCANQFNIAIDHAINRTFITRIAFIPFNFGHQIFVCGKFPMMIFWWLLSDAIRCDAQPKFNNESIQQLQLIATLSEVCFSFYLLLFEKCKWCSWWIRHTRSKDTPERIKYKKNKWQSCKFINSINPDLLAL